MRGDESYRNPIMQDICACTCKRFGFEFEFDCLGLHVRYDSCSPSINMQRNQVRVTLSSFCQCPLHVFPHDAERYSFCFYGQIPNTRLISRHAYYRLSPVVVDVDVTLPKHNLDHMEQGCTTRLG